MHHAVNDPKELRKMEPRRLAVEDMDMNRLPGMLRIPKKKKAETNGQ